MLRDVTKTFGTNPVLRGINLEVDLHQVVCLIGASGSGKSTMLRCINQLETVDSGEIHLGGDRVSGRGIDVDALRREVGIVFQAFNLFPHMSGSRRRHCRPTVVPRGAGIGRERRRPPRRVCATAPHVARATSHRRAPWRPRPIVRPGATNRPGRNWSRGSRSRPRRYPRPRWHVTAHPRAARRVER